MHSLPADTAHAVQRLIAEPRRTWRTCRFQVVLIETYCKCPVFIEQLPRHPPPLAATAAATPAATVTNSGSVY